MKSRDDMMAVAMSQIALIGRRKAAAFARRAAAALGYVVLNTEQEQARRRKQIARGIIHVS